MVSIHAALPLKAPLQRPLPKQSDQAVLKALRFGQVETPGKPDLSHSIQKRVDRFKRQLTELIAEDRKHHPANPVIQRADIDQLAAQASRYLIRQQNANVRMIPFLIGIAGPSASGKTLVKNRLLDALRETAKTTHQWNPAMGPVADAVETDHFYKDTSALRKQLGDVAYFREVNLDEPDIMNLSLFQKAIQTLRKGQGVLMPYYHYGSSEVYSKSGYQSPSPFMIVEGLFTLLDKAFGGSKKPLQSLMDMKIYVDVDKETMAERWWKRAPSRNVFPDAAGNALFSRVMTMTDKHILPTREQANLVLNGTADLNAIDKTLASLSQLLLETFYPITPPLRHNA